MGSGGRVVERSGGGVRVASPLRSRWERSNGRPTGSRPFLPGFVFRIAHPAAAAGALPSALRPRSASACRSHRSGPPRSACRSPGGSDAGRANNVRRHGHRRRGETRRFPLTGDRPWASPCPTSSGRLLAEGIAPRYAPWAYRRRRRRRTVLRGGRSVPSGGIAGPRAHVHHPARRGPQEGRRGRGPRGRSRHIADVVARQVRRDHARQVFAELAGVLKGSTTWGTTDQEVLETLRALRGNWDRPWIRGEPDALSAGHDGPDRPRLRPGRGRGAARASGPRSLADAIIAGVARSLDATGVTRNPGDFEIQGSPSWGTATRPPDPRHSGRRFPQRPLVALPRRPVLLEGAP